MAPFSSLLLARSDGVQIVADGKNRSRDVTVLGRGMQPADVRQTNQRAILSVISLDPGVSNADLARTTHLAPQTVSAILADLERAHLITRGEVLRGRRGQPATPVFMNPTGAFAIGVEIGWSQLEVTLVGIGTQVLSRYRREYEYPDAATVFTEMGEAVAQVLAMMSQSERSRLIGLGLAAPGGIGDPLSLAVPPPGQAELWAGIDIAKRAAEVTGLSVQLVNDGNAACWAERVAHPAPRPQNFAFLLIGTWVGAGIIAENRLWEGVTGASANLGSMLVTDRQGASRFVHEIASLHALRPRLKAVGFDLPAVMQDPPAPEVQAVLDVWIEDAAFALAQIVLNTATVIEYEVAIVETHLPVAILTRVIEAMNRDIQSVPSLGRGKPHVIAGHLGHSGAAEGAALLRMYRRFFSRELAHLEG